MKSYVNNKILIGVSGGPDSMYLLDNIVSNNNYKQLVVCHVNYNLRGQDSIRDKEIVIDYCLKHNLCYEVLEVFYDKKNRNLENWARQIRYDFFLNIINKYNFDLVLIAHNLNDHIETYTMQLLRNNITNCWGISEKTIINNIVVERPILNIYKSQILKYLDDKNIRYGVDITNFDEKYLRNRIRKKLDENNFQKYIEEINYLNKEILGFHQKYKKFYESDSFDIRIISDLEQKYKQFFLYNFLVYNGLESIFSNLKKQFLKEVLKQISSPKKNIFIKSKGFIIYKDNYLIYIYK